MSSNINPMNINASYPIAGQDNDSQGFRDNFTNIRTNLTYAQKEIEDLQAKAVLKAPLTGSTGTTVANDLTGVELRGANTIGFTSTVDNLGAVLGDTVVEFSNGDMHQITASDALVLKLGWNPVVSGTYATMRIWLTITSVTQTVKFTGPTVGFVGHDKLGTVTGTALEPILTPAIGQYILEFGTVDAGSTVYVAAIIKP